MEDNLFLSLMNPAIQNLMTRRSVRGYTSQMPSVEDIQTICEAGTYAPSGKSTQCPIILAVTNREMRDRMSRLNAQVLGTPDSDPFYGAPVVLVVLVDRKTGLTPVEDGCLVMGNMLNAAHALGLGSCWINRARQVFDSEEGKSILKELGIEGDYLGIGNCVVGYAAQPEPQPKPRKADYIHWVK